MPPSSLEIVARQICNSRGFVFGELAGRGAFKETFRVVAPDKTQRALKVFQLDFPPERTAREIDALTQCRHPNIARLESVSHFPQDGNQFFYAIEEFIPGGTLSARLKSKGLLTPDEVYLMGCDLIAAVAHIACRNLVHRDLKPDNVLLRADGITPVIVDFGLVRNLELSSITQTWLPHGPGTPLFSPPEQLNNEKAYIDWRADQFSLGVTLSFAGFDLHPFADPGSQPVKVIEDVAQRKPLTASFIEAARQSQLPVLIKMVAPWPIERIRRPEDLITAWTEQRR